MALHNTQCPHCFTTYVISDEQLRVSEGMVRCGTCRERFQARLLDDQKETPRFDPREAFIEPLSEEFDAQKKAAVKALIDAEPEEFSFADVHTETEKSISLSDVSESINSELSIDVDDNVPVAPVNANQLSAEEMLANIRAKQLGGLGKRQAPAQTAVTPTKEPTNITPGQQELALPNTKDTEPTQTQSQNRDALIDQVDSLVQNKLVNAASATAAAQAVDVEIEEPFQLDRKSKIKAKPRSWLSLLSATLLLIVVLLLATVFIYQLWMKQIIVFKEDSIAQKKIVELSAPVAKKLAEYDIVLPMRRNLSKLELASARTEAHPSRPSTTLLRISIINHADIEQPLPWLEMSLTDAEGRLVSRRSLSPRDYVYQNATNDLIGARELKKVTIELLSFPKQATGYELKILDK